MQTRVLSIEDFQVQLQALLQQFPCHEDSRSFYCLALEMAKTDLLFSSALMGFLSELLPIRKQMVDKKAVQLYGHLLQPFLNWKDISIAGIAHYLNLGARFLQNTSIDNNRLYFFSEYLYAKQFYYHVSPDLMQYMEANIASTNEKFFLMENKKVIELMIDAGFLFSEKKHWAIFHLLKEKRFAEPSLKSLFLAYLGKIRTEMEAPLFVVDEGVKWLFSHWGIEKPGLRLEGEVTNACLIYQGLSQLTEGPLNKSRSTRLFESVLHELVSTPLEKVMLTPLPLNQYQLSFRGGLQSVNLSLLIKTMNFTHLLHDDAIIQKIDNYLREELQVNLHYLIPVDASVALPRVLASLPPCLQGAIHNYTHEDKRVINALLRGEEILGPFDARLILSSLLVSVLAAEALNRIPLLLHDENIFKKAKAILNKIKNQDDTFDFQKIFKYTDLAPWLAKAIKAGVVTSEEAEKLKVNFEAVLPLLGGYDELIRSEVYDDEKKIPYDVMVPRPISAFISTSCQGGTYKPSASINGYHLFTKFSGHHPHRLMINALSRYPGEREVILPPGSYLCVNQRKKVSDRVYHQEAAMLTSPAVVVGSYYACLALQTAYTDYLSKPFSEMPHVIQMKAGEVHRPNHGLAHAHGLMKYLPMVLAYFASHAKESALAEFSHHISDDHLDCLMMVAAFAQTGRASQVSFKHDEQRHRAYRLASADHLVRFMQTLPPSFFKEDKVVVISRCRDALIHLGDQRAVSSQDPLLACYHRILGFTFFLDYQRCFSAQRYQAELAGFEHLFHQTQAKDRDLFHMQCFVGQWLAARGDRCEFVVTAPHQYHTIKKGYDEHFVTYNQEIGALYRLSSQFRVPQFARMVDDNNLTKCLN